MYNNDLLVDPSKHKISHATTATHEPVLEKKHCRVITSTEALQGVRSLLENAKADLPLKVGGAQPGMKLVVWTGCVTANRRAAIIASQQHPQQLLVKSLILAAFSPSIKVVELPVKTTPFGQIGHFLQPTVHCIGSLILTAL